MVSIYVFVCMRTAMNEIFMVKTWTSPWYSEAIGPWNARYICSLLVFRYCCDLVVTMCEWYFPNIYHSDYAWINQCGQMHSQILKHWYMCSAMSDVALLFRSHKHTFVCLHMCSKYTPHWLWFQSRFLGQSQCQCKSE